MAVVLLGSQIKTFYFLILFVNLTCSGNTDMLVPWFTHVTYVPGNYQRAGEQETPLSGIGPRSAGPVWSVMAGIIPQTSFFLPRLQFPHL